MMNYLVSVEASAALDAEAQKEWGFDVHALVESAGRNCAQVFMKAFPEFFRKNEKENTDLVKSMPRVTVASGAGNNGADAMVMLRYWILSAYVDPLLSTVVVSRMPKTGEAGPWVSALASLRKMKVPVMVWDGDEGEKARISSDDIFAHSDLIIDGIAGTGISGALRGKALEMANAVNFHRNHASLSGFRGKRFVVSIDLPSGSSDEWENGQPIIEADATLAIEPLKYCLYTPAARSSAGIILPVKGIFPHELIACHAQAESLEWKIMKERVSKILPTAYKQQRGTVEIWAGSSGATGAALIAALGAQAAGAGLVRLVVDEEIYPVLASQVAGIMVFPGSSGEVEIAGRAFLPDALLLGPGWGKKHNREQILENALALERKGVPLVLDADAIELAKDKVFSGNTILTPHPGEFSKFSGLVREEALSRPIPILLKYAKERKAVILFKGHVITIVAPDGRIGIIDGMAPGLAAGGSGDLLAGFCVAVAARMAGEGRGIDMYTCAAAAAALLIASGKTKETKHRFTDPLEIAGRAADLAGEAWLSSI